MRVAPHGPAGLTRLATIASTVPMKASSQDGPVDESHQPKRGVLDQFREGLFGALFVMAKDTQVVKHRLIVLLFINLIQVRGLMRHWLRVGRYS